MQFDVLRRFAKHTIFEFEYWFSVGLRKFCMLCLLASKRPCVDVLLVPAVSFLFDIFSGAVD